MPNVSRRLVLVIASAFVAAATVGFVTVLEMSTNSNPTSTPSDSTVPLTSPSPTDSSSQPSESQPMPSEAQLPSPPATTSGGLTGRTLPSAHSLGAGWIYRIDKGSAEGGYVGNGTPTLARDPHEVVMTVLPLGCLKRSDLPMPTHVLEADYRLGAHGIFAVGLRLRFADAHTASQFFATRQADLTACAAQPSDPADHGLRLVTGMSGTGEGTYVSARTDPSLPSSARTWTEIAGALGGRDIVLLAVNAPPDSTSVNAEKLSAAVRAVLR